VVNRVCQIGLWGLGKTGKVETIENGGKVYRNDGKLWKILEKGIVILENFGKLYRNFGKYQTIFLSTCAFD